MRRLKAAATGRQNAGAPWYHLQHRRLLMKTIAPLALCALLLLSCGKTVTGQLSDMNAKVDDLASRVKNLEDDRLKLEKQLIQSQQAVQAMREQMRNMEDYFNRLQVSQSTPH